MTDRAEALLQTRLLGGPNRIAWGAQDVQRIARRFGLQSGDAVDGIAKRLSINSDVATVARRFKPPADASRYDIIASTARMDRMNDIIEQNWELGPYKARPVVLFGHDASVIPVGGCLSIGVTGGALKATLAFAPANSNKLAGEVQASVDAGITSGISVGFRPLEWKWIDDGFSIRFLKSELLELSWCSIPANSDCGLIGVTGGAKSTSGGTPIGLYRRRLDLMKQDLR
jgi:HK97 family phage prohead protease